MKIIVKIPKEVVDIFNWLVKYDPAFNGSAKKVAAHLIRVGAEAVYKDSLLNYHNRAGK